MKKQFYQCGNRAVAIILLLGLALALNPGVTAQKQSRDGIQLRISYEHGYRAGYADGYDAGRMISPIGWDANTSDTLSIRKPIAVMNPASARGWTIKGYSLGFEVGYFDGYVGRAFDLGFRRMSRILTPVSSL